jgi:ribose transport system substrate-binding protein
MHVKFSVAIISGGLALAASGVAAETIRVGITQNNVGVDSYQTTYEQAFIAEADANPDVEAIVLDAGGDVARQIAQIQDLIQQRVDVIIIWPTNGKAVVGGVRPAHHQRLTGFKNNKKKAQEGQGVKAYV